MDGAVSEAYGSVTRGENVVTVGHGNHAPGDLQEPPVKMLVLPADHVPDPASSIALHEAPSAVLMYAAP